MKVFNWSLKKKGYSHQRKKKLMELTRDIARGRYLIYLQPKQRLSTDRIDHGEVLVRYRNHGKDTLPSNLLQELEGLELIHVLDLYVFEVTCKLLQEWKQQRRQFIRLSCNFSRVTLCQPDILQQLEVLRNRYGIRVEDIEIEITETVQPYSESYMQVVEMLHKQGYSLTMDDFGSGYGNLIFLASLPFTCIKLDRSLIYEMQKNMKMIIMIEHVIQCAHQLGLEVVAEGVETQGQKEALKALECDYIQGYYLHEPMPKEDFEWLYIESLKRMKYSAMSMRNEYA